MPTNPQIDDLVEGSKIIFIGTVQAIGRSTVANHPATSNTATVKVNRTLRVPPSLTDLPGQIITVELARAGIQAGADAVFFTNGLVYADSLVVQEVGRMAAGAPGAPRQAQIANVTAAIRRQPQRHIQRRLQTADLVVTGRVASVRKAPLVPGARISEHDPDWREATIDVEAVESGLPAKQVSLLFPASRDIRWRACPKFAEGQEGVWILHKHEIPEVRTPGYVALNRADFHAKPRRRFIKALIQNR